ncbi:hypothetical protein BLOT_005664 [Blomia tropicalis]|nr:hypothetical protein BLOT_005664 [Blomia tropicalis]
MSVKLNMGLMLTLTFVVFLVMVPLIQADSGEYVTPWTPYRTGTKKPPHFSVMDLFNLQPGEVAGGQYIRRCITCDMPRLFPAFH